VLGVYGLSALLLVQAGALLAFASGRGRQRLVPLALALTAWTGGAVLGRVEWTRASGAPVPVAIVQGAIPQDEKWQLDNLEPTKLRYRALNDQSAEARLIVWPESAIPELANLIAPFLAEIQASSRARNADVVMGVVRLGDNGRDYYNSILALTGTGAVFYDKRHLVPYSEFLPVPAFVRQWLRLMNLPYADFTSGSELQAPLLAGGLKLAPTVCYEDGFGSAQLALVRASDVLVNVTNDAWFGHSPARYQHLQIARMRALESGRYLLRAGNDGISAIISAREYQPALLSGTVVPRGGLSPYLRLGNRPVLVLALLGAAGAAWRRRVRAGVRAP
jgi:apolipoprotein N-acyltransferase